MIDSDATAGGGGGSPSPQTNPGSAAPERRDVVALGTATRRPSRYKYTATHSENGAGGEAAHGATCGGKEGGRLPGRGRASGECAWGLVCGEKEGGWRPRKTGGRSEPCN